MVEPTLALVAALVPVMVLEVTAVVDERHRQFVSAVRLLQPVALLVL